MMPLLLASASPRRRALLAEAGVACEVAAADVVELRETMRRISMRCRWRRSTPG